MTEAVEQPPVIQAPERSGRFAFLRQKTSTQPPPNYPTLYSKVAERPRDEIQGVREEWVDAIVDGNKDFPQLNFGIDLYLASALLTNPPGNWNHLIFSDLSQAQVDRIGARMSEVHRSRGIQTVHSSASPTPEEKAINDQRINRFWAGIRNETLKFIEDNLPEKGNINSSLSDPQVASSLTQKILTLREVLTRDEMEALLKPFKQILNKKVALKDRLDSPVLAEIAEGSGVALESEESRETIKSVLIKRMEGLVRESGSKNGVNVDTLIAKTH